MGNTSRRIVVEFIGKDKSLGDTSTKMTGTLATFGKKAALGFAAATAAGALFLAKVGAPYVDSLNKIQSLTDASNTKMRRVARTLERNAGLYAKMGLTTGDAADGVVELTKAGMSLDDAMRSVNATMVLAKAGELSVADASSLVSNTLNTFKLKAKDAATVANVLANAANVSSADVSDMAQSLAMVSNVAAGAGASVQETAAMLAELSNAGMKGSDAGTSLKTMLLSLQAPSSTASQGLKSLGVSAFNAAGKARPIRDVLADLDKKFRGLTDQKRAKLMKNIFGTDAFRAARVVFGNGSKALDDYVKKVGKAGAAQKLANSASKGLMGTIKTGIALIKSFGQQLYRVLSPIVNKALKPLVRGFGQFTTKAIPMMSAAARKAGPALSKMFAGLKGGKAADELSKTGAALLAFGKGLLPVIKEFGQKLMKVLGPGLAQVGTLLRDQFLPSFRQLLPVLQPVAKFLLKFFGDAVIGAVKGMLNILQGAIKMISGIFNLIADIVHGRWGELWGDVKQILGGALQAIIGAIQVWWNMGILAIFKRGFMFLTKGIWVKGWTLLKTGTMAAFKGIEKAALKGIEGIGKLLWAGVKGYFTLWKKYFGLIKDIVTTGWKVLRSVFGGAISAIRSMLSVLWSGIKSGFSAMWSAVKGGVSAAWGGIRKIVSTGIERVVKFVKGIPGRITKALGDLGNLLYDAGRAVIQGLIDGIWSKVFDAAGGLISTLHSVTSLVQRNKGPIEKDRILLKPAGVALMEGLIDGIESRRRPLQTVLEKLTAYIERTGSKIADLMSKRSDIISSFQGFTSSVFGADLSNPDTGAAPTVGALLKYQAQQKAKALRLKRDVRKLVKLGLSKDLIQQMADEGESGMAQIHALAQGSASDVAAMNAMNAATNAALNDAGVSAGNAMYGTQIADAQKDLRLAQAIAKELKKLRDQEDKDTRVMLIIDGKVLRTSLLQLKRHSGKNLGLA